MCQAGNTGIIAAMAACTTPLRMPPMLVVLISAKRFHRPLSGRPAGTTQSAQKTPVPLLYQKLSSTRKWTGNGIYYGNVHGDEAKGAGAAVFADQGRRS